MNLHGVLNNGQGRRLRASRGAAMVAAVCVAMLGGIATAVTASATSDKVWICHATSSDKNPYEIIHPSVDSAKYEGHLSHLTDPPHKWKSDGTFGGVVHNAGQKKVDIFGAVNAESAPPECFPTKDDTKFGNLTLVKVVDNTGGGTMKASAWTLTAAGPTPFSGETPASSEVVVGPYTLSEDGPSGYTASAWDCRNAELSRSVVTAPTVTVGDNEDVTCTITNTFIPPETHMANLTLIKVVKGGDASPSDWTLSAEGPTSFSGTSEVTHAVERGKYTLSESDGPANYDASDWTCRKTREDNADVNLAQSTDEAFTMEGKNTVKIKNKDVTCTITNTFVAPHTALLTLVKSVNNSAGGSAQATAWTLDATGGPTAFAEDTTGVHQQVADGTYTLSESPATTANYSASLWDCTNAEANATTVVIGPNDREVTCTITNTFVPPPPVVDLTTVAAPVFTPGTCLAVGSVVAPETSAYAWFVSGPGTARSYQAVAKSGYTLTGATSFGPFDLSQLPADSPACVVTPTVVTPAPTVAGVVKNAPVKAPVVAGVVKSAPVKTLAFTGAETVPLGLSGLLALLLGTVLTAASRQRPKKARE